MPRNILAIHYFPRLKSQHLDLTVSRGWLCAMPSMTHCCSFGANLCAVLFFRAYPTVPNGCLRCCRDGFAPYHLSYGDVPPSRDDVTHMLGHIAGIVQYLSASAQSLSLVPTVISCSIAIDFSRKSPRARSATPLYCGVSGGLTS